MLTIEVLTLGTRGALVSTLCLTGRGDSIRLYWTRCPYDYCYCPLHGVEMPYPMRPGPDDLSLCTS
jgi:hypothetical protein